LVRAARFFYARELAVRRQPISLRPPVHTGNSSGIRVLLLGDSRVAEWPSLPANFYTINAGIPSETTTQVLRRAPAIFESEKPDVVVIQAGINDLKAIGVSPADAVEIKTNCLRNLSELVALSRERRAKVILTLILPSGKIPLVRRLFWSEEVNRAVAEVNQQLSNLYGGQPGIAILDLGKVLADRSSATSSLDAYRDALHLKPEAYQKLQMALLSLLEQPHPPAMKPAH
jgi:lysophospholipase L1-like esterase